MTKRRGREAGASSHESGNICSRKCQTVPSCVLHVNQTVPRYCEVSSLLHCLNLCWLELARHRLHEKAGKPWVDWCLCGQPVCPRSPLFLDLGRDWLNLGIQQEPTTFQPQATELTATSFGQSQQQRQQPFPNWLAFPVPCPCCNNYSPTDHSWQEDDKVINVYSVKSSHWWCCLCCSCCCCSLLCGTQTEPRQLVTRWVEATSRQRGQDSQRRDHSTHHDADRAKNTAENRLGFVRFDIIIANGVWRRSCQGWPSAPENLIVLSTILYLFSSIIISSARSGPVGIQETCKVGKKITS